MKAKSDQKEASERSKAKAKRSDLPKLQCFIYDEYFPLKIFLIESVRIKLDFSLHFWWLKKGDILCQSGFRIILLQLKIF